MAQKNYEKLLTELMKKIPQNRLVKHLFLNYTIGKGGNVNPEKPDVPINKNDAFQKVQKRRVQEKR